MSLNNLNDIFVSLLHTITITLSMKKGILSFLLLAAFISFNSVSAQNRTCGTDHAVRTALNSHPELQIQMDELEEFTQHYSMSTERVTRVIPIVFHVIHNYGQENISKEQILDAVRIINEDFQLQNEDQSSVIPEFQDIVANMEIEFRLAKIDPNGNCTEGITRTVSELTFSADDNVKELVSWPRNKYLNVWVVDQISFSAGGYAYLPGSAPSAQDDGIVVLHNQLGSIGTSNGSNFAARTLTHEIGHFLNLRHTWGPTNSPGDPENCDFDDGVNDTPNTIGVAGQNCNLAQSTCGFLDNVQNYMDYSSCAIMYTEGQKQRVLATLNSGTAGRNNLWTAANLTATGVSGTAQVCTPIVDFNSNTDEDCANNQIVFTDLSYNAEIDETWTWNWTFPGGNPSSSTEQNPVVVYSQPGNYEVSLTITNSAGSASKTKTNYLLINTDQPNLVAPIVEGVENETFPLMGWQAVDWRFASSNNNALERTTAAASTGNASIRYNNMQVADGTVSHIYSPVINCTYVGTPANMKFKLAYAQRGGASEDKLEVWISIDCGKTWTRRYSKAGSALATRSGFVSAPWTPGAADWREESVSVVPIAGKQTAMFRFTIIDGGGNNIYIDDINIVDAPIGIVDAQSFATSLEVYPNPGSGNANIAYTLSSASDIELTVRDIAGRVLGSYKTGYIPAGEYTTQLNSLTGVDLRSGIYMISIRSGNNSITTRWLNN